MNAEISQINTKLAALQTELGGLREGYVVINKRYSDALDAINCLTSHAKDAAARAAAAAAKCLEAATHSLSAAQAARDILMACQPLWQSCSI